jgi:chromosome partitioning protein
METIVLATQKGGSGKSTLAVNLAVSAREHGLTVRLIETDPQGTLSNWQRRRNFGSPLVESVGNASRLEQQLAIFASENVALTIIDTASGISTLTNAAIRHTDLCLIPVRPSMLDIEAAASTLGTARAAKTSFGFILNHATVRGRRMESAEAALADEAALELGDILARPYIGMRSDHQDALARGMAVTEYAPAGKAANEIRQLWRWVSDKLARAADRGRSMRIDRSWQNLEPQRHWVTSTAHASLPHRFRDF